MTFDWAGLIRFIYLWFFRTPWTGRRILVALAFLLVMPPLQALVWIGLTADELLFRRYRRVRVDAPLFIIGNPRSGTTLLHRLLAEDRVRFSSMQMWEVLFAPSVLARRLVATVAALDRRLGRPLRRRIARMEATWRARNVMHEVSLFAPEEDDYLLLHIWSALTIGLSAGLLAEARRYTRFDAVLPEARRRRIMRFYRRCVQRHLYHTMRRLRRDGPPTYLAKNPALAPKLDSLFAAFPDARIIYVVRNPLDVVPSYLSVMQFSWRALGVPVPTEALRDYVLEMAHHWYQYPLERLSQAPLQSHIIINYEQLLADPKGTIDAIYAHFAFEVDPAFARRLAQRSEHIRHYQSRHDYDPEYFGLSRQRIVTRFADIFDRFNFNRG